MSSNATDHPDNKYRLGLPEWLHQQVNNGLHKGVVWIDAREQIFQIPWKHASMNCWEDTDASLFKAWAVYTNRYREGVDQPKHKQWKSNFRCAINSHNRVFFVKEADRGRGTNRRIIRIVGSLGAEQKYETRVPKRRLYTSSRSKSKDEELCVGDVKEITAEDNKETLENCAKVLLSLRRSSSMNSSEGYQPVVDNDDVRIREVHMERGDECPTRNQDSSKDDDSRADAVGTNESVQDNDSVQNDDLARNDYSVQNDDLARNDYSAQRNDTVHKNDNLEKNDILQKNDTIQKNESAQKNDFLRTHDDRGRSNSKPKMNSTTSRKRRRIENIFPPPIITVPMNYCPIVLHSYPPPIIEPRIGLVSLPRYYIPIADDHVTKGHRGTDDHQIFKGHRPIVDHKVAEEHRPMVDHQVSKQHPSIVDNQKQIKQQVSRNSTNKPTKCSIPTTVIVTINKSSQSSQPFDLKENDSDKIKCEELDEILDDDDLITPRDWK